MLVLSRGVGESIVIGDDIEVFLIHSDRGKARIGIKAPKNVVVNRREIADRLLAEKKEEPKQP